MGIDPDNLIRVLNFLPYPLLISEYRQGAQHNVFVNLRFREEIGYTCEEIPTITDWFEKAYPDEVYREALLREWMERLQQAKEISMDSVVTQARIHTKYHGHKWYEVKASVLGRINFVVFVNIDEEISRERELEKLNENKNRILSILSHDLRSPLVNLRAVLDMAARNLISPEEENEIFKKISAQVFQMTELLDTTLHWSKTNFAEIRQERRLINIKPIVRNYLQLYQDAIKQKKIEIFEHIDAATAVLSDPEILSIVLRNLISNAIKYTRTGGVIKIEDTVEGDRYALIVENSGDGITQDRISEILQRSYASEPGTLGEKGLGLGLKLCQQLLDKIGGHLEIEQRGNTHAVFRIVLPATLWLSAHSLVPTTV